MTHAETLLALAARVEAGTGPDRELDAEIARAVWPRAEIGPLGAPKFTKNMQTALVYLRPKGHAWSLHGDSDGTAVAGCERDDGEGCTVAGSHGATPALAITAAALRAIAAEAGNG